jgi:hypothetical protein
MVPARRDAGLHGALVPTCACRGRTLVFAGLGICLLIGVTLLCINDRIIEGLALAFILLLVGMNFVRGYAVVLTDRRLLVFRTRGVFIAHLRGIFIAAPRGGVSTVFRRRLGWGVLSVAFAPGTGKAPVEFHFVAAHTLIAESIHLVLATRVTNAQAAPGSPAGR